MAGSNQPRIERGGLSHLGLGRGHGLSIFGHQILFGAKEEKDKQHNIAKLSSSTLSGTMFSVGIFVQGRGHGAGRLIDRPITNEDQFSDGFGGIKYSLGLGLFQGPPRRPMAPKGELASFNDRFIRRGRGRGNHQLLGKPMDEVVVVQEIRERCMSSSSSSEEGAAAQVFGSGTLTDDTDIEYTTFGDISDGLGEGESEFDICRYDNDGHLVSKGQLDNRYQVCPDHLKIINAMERVKQLLLEQEKQEEGKQDDDHDDGDGAD